jgi:Protein of unknown function (DUF3455)
MEKSRLGLGLLLAVVVSGACFAACGDDDNPPAAGTGGGGTGGTGGKGGSGGSTGGTAGKGGGGTGGTAGNAGTGGGSSDAGDAGDACSIPGISHTKPTVASNIDAPAGTTLVGGYYASGDQIYTCVPNPAPADAGSGDAGDAGPGGTWANTADATLYGDNCAEAAHHSYTATPGSPQWAAKDGSTVVATRVAAAPVVADGGDGGATAIPWVLLKATSNTGEGVYANVTYVQRVNTTGGLGPSGACEPGDANPVKRVAYTATYYFYTGGNSEAGTSEGGSSEAGEASTTDTGTPDTGTTEAGAD